MRMHWLIRNPKKKGRTSIYATVRYRGKVAILFPRESIDTFMWINKNGVNKLKPIAENSALKGRLEDFEKDVRQVYNDLQKTIQGIVPPELLKKTDYDKLFPPDVPIGEIDEVKPILITDFFQTLIDDSNCGDRRGPNREVLNPNSIKPYRSASHHFKEFQKEQKKIYHLTDISQKLVNDFTNYLEITKNLSFNACAKYLTVFKLLISYAQEKGVIDVNKLMAIKFHIRRGESENIYLNEKQIETFSKVTNLPTKVYETVRDLFVIQCWSGLRYSDVSRLRLENINNGFIEITQQKVNAKVVIPVHKLVRQILEKYPNGLPKCPPNQVFNRYLKEIGKQVPELDVEFEKKILRSKKNGDPEVFKKYQLLQTHSGRRSYCTNMYLMGFPILSIMAISGHKTQENFKKYIKAESLLYAQNIKKQFDEDEKREEDEQKKKDEENNEDCEGCVA